MEKRPGALAQATAELRQAWRDLAGGLRASAGSIGGEGRAMLADLDAPALERPGFWRRVWRGFRARTPAPLQALLALALVAAWALLVWHVFVSPALHPRPQPPPARTGVRV